MPTKSPPRSAQPPSAEDRARLRHFFCFVFPVFFTVFAAVHFYIGWRLLYSSSLAAAVSPAACSLLLLSAFFIPFASFAPHFVKRTRLTERLAWAGNLMMGWLSSLFILTLLRDFVFFIPAAHHWERESALGVFILSVLLTGIGLIRARQIATVRTIDIPLTSLPAELDGFTIAQISDLHIGPTIKAPYVQKIVDKVNALTPDMVAITGDFVDGDIAHIAEDVRPLGELKSRYGTYGVTGNHDYYSGASAWMKHFEKMGMIILMNAHAVITHNGALLVLAGVNDYDAAAVSPGTVSDPLLAVKGAPAEAVQILLAHQPRSAKAAAEAGIDLQLSGHTHGGQFWPWQPFVRLQQPVTAGLHKMGKMWLYVSRGTGYWGPPKRLGAPSEITLITLRKGL